MNNEQIIPLFNKYLDQQASPEEIRELLRYFDLEDDQTTLRSLIQQEMQRLDAQPEIPAAVKHFVQKVDETLPLAIDRYEARKNTRRLPILKYAAIAALFLVALATALYFYPSLIVNHKSSGVNDIAPGGNRATLTLADGTKVALDSAQSGIIVNDESIKYSNGGSVPGVILSGVRGNEGKGAEGSLPTSLSLTTPKGGQYQIILPDGTKVWLNAASTLKYPSRFSGNKREVFLEGEGYFEVNNKMAETHSTALHSAQGDAKSVKPFIVKTPKQEVQVLGTSFNLSAYSTETSERTTLVEGKVQVRTQNLQRKTVNLKLLEPKQQAVVKGDSLTISKADVETETAWRSGLFNFTDKKLSEVMPQLARWYNIEVVYAGKVPDIEFFGEIRRNNKLSNVLDMLQKSGVKFRLEKERRLIVYE